MSKKKNRKITLFIYSFSKSGAEDEEEFEDATDEPNNEAKKRGPGAGKKVRILFETY